MTSTKSIIQLKRTDVELYNVLNKHPIKGVLQGARKLSKGITGKRIVFFVSKKNNSLMPCESRLEADNCLALEFNKSVVTYRTQPFTITLGGNNTYTPDTLHIDKLGSLVVREVKFSGALECEKLLKRLSKIKSVLLNVGVSFEVHTEKNLQITPRLQNMKYLYRCSHIKFIDIQINEALRILPEIDNNYTLEEFREDCKNHNLDPLIADKLLFEGLADYNQGSKLSIKSSIWRIGDKL